MQTLNGKAANNDGGSYTVSAGVFRHAIGNWNFTADGGVATAYTIFTVTGDVLLSVFGVCQASVTGGAGVKMELGIVDNTAALIAQTDATLILLTKPWQDAAPETNPGVQDVFGGARQFVIADGADVILTISAAAATAGNIDFHAMWLPLSLDGNLVAA